MEGWYKAKEPKPCQIFSTNLKACCLPLRKSLSGNGDLGRKQSGQIQNSIMAKICNLRQQEHFRSMSYRDTLAWKSTVYTQVYV